MEDWQNVVSTDETRFCLDDPDGQGKFWADSRLPQDIFAKRARGGGGIMIWAEISWKGKTKLAVLERTMNAAAYTSMLQD